MYFGVLGAYNHYALKERKRSNVDMSLILKIAGIGVLVAIVSMILNKSGKDEQSTLVTVAGIVVVMLMIVSQLGELIGAVRSVFGF